MAIFGFDTEDQHAATASLLLYAVYRSRDRARFKVTPDMWERIERQVRASAKRATDLPLFLEKLKPKLQCGTVSPRWMAVGMAGEIPAVVTEEGVRLQIGPEPGQREFLARVFDEANHAGALHALRHKSAFVILLTRDRLEREKSVEARFAADEEAA